MKTKEVNNEKKESQKTNPIPCCGDFQKMAAMMNACCPDEDSGIDCCSMMRRMMGQRKNVGTGKTNDRKHTKN